MERKKSRTCSDELALMKAAAWAWYQHGSGSEGKPMPEFELTTTKRASYRPSRYKLEAVRKNTANATDGSQPSRNSLLDSYEVESISKRLDQYIDSSGIKFYDNLFVIDGDYQKNLVLDGDRRKKRRNKLKWFLPRPAVVCGSNRDVDERAFRDDADRRLRSEKHGAVIKMIRKAAHA